MKIVHDFSTMCHFFTRMTFTLLDFFSLEAYQIVLWLDIHLKVEKSSLSSCEFINKKNMIIIQTNAIDNISQVMFKSGKC